MHRGWEWQRKKCLYPEPACSPLRRSDEGGWYVSSSAGIPWIKTRDILQPPPPSSNIITTAECPPLSLTLEFWALCKPVCTGQITGNCLVPHNRVGLFLKIIHLNIGDVKQNGTSSGSQSQSKWYNQSDAIVGTRHSHHHQILCMPNECPSMYGPI